LVPNLEAKFCITIDTESSPNNAEEVPTGEMGELYVKGPNIFAGYHNNPEATRTCLDPDGWFRTGDIGFLDEEGNLFITDRAKELIKYKGFQVPPAELEGLLLEHEVVDDAVVVGVQSQRLATEVPRAYVVRKVGSSAASPGEEVDIMRWLDSRVAPHKRLRGGLKFVDSISKSPSGKILRRYIRDQAQREYSSIEMASRDTRL
jgi:acyl-CoA synthetase (AMP-forming)/AMP-acid ligase II